MSIEGEFTRWLNRPEKTFTETLRFAIKAWKSSEFTLSTKYEKVFAWLSANWEGLHPHTTEFQAEEVTELLQLKCPAPGLVPLDVKRELVGSFVKFSNIWSSPNDRQVVEILQIVAENEIFQDLFRFDYECYAQLLGQLFKCYARYLRTFGGTLLQAHETEFFNTVVTALKGHAKKAAAVSDFEKKFSAHIIQSLVEVIIIFQDKGMRFLADLLDLEKSLCEDYKETDLLSRFMRFPTHVNLMALECAIVNFRGDATFFKNLVVPTFCQLVDTQHSEDPILSLTIAAYTLEMFRKHDMMLNFKIGAQTASEFFGSKVFAFVEKFRSSHLQEVLTLLCATLRFNPLVLEKNIFQITAWMIVATKEDTRQQETFEEFLILLMEMFRKLSRAEKFVGSLLKSVKDLLKTHKLEAGKKTERKRKRQMNGGLNNSLSEQKKKLKLDDGESKSSNQIPSDTDYYLQVLFRDFRERPKTLAAVTPQCNEKLICFPHLSSAWPSKTVGTAFSKLIVGLMSKPSIVIWKTLIFSLKEVLETVDSHSPPSEQLDENTLFLLDFHSAMLCEYLAGSKLPEQSDKVWNEIQSNRELTRNTLQQFGQLLLSLEHNNRTMNAFLESAYFAAYFDLLLWHYRPDSIHDDQQIHASSKNLHDFLTADEWVLLQQRVINFGKVECKFNTNRLLFQRSKAKILFSRHHKSINLQKVLISSTGSDFEQIKLLFADGRNSWLLRYLKKEEKSEICEAVVNELNIKLMKNFIEDCESFELIAIGLYHKLAECFAASCETSILAAIDFEKLKLLADVVDERRAYLVANAINQKVDNYLIEKFAVESVAEIFEVLRQLPIGSCRKHTKGVLVALHLALYLDLKAAQDERLAGMAIDVLTDILHFGKPVQLLRFFPTENLLRILPPSTAWEFYEFIFATIKLDEKVAEQFFTSLAQILKTAQAESEITGDHVRLILISIETLNGSKRLKKFLDDILQIYAVHVNSFFANTDNRNAKKDKRFVEKTLSGFSVYANSVLSEVKPPDGELDEKFRRLCKIYIGYSMDCHNPHALKLITIALNHCVVLDFGQDEISFVLDNYWTQLNADLKAKTIDEKTAESVVKIVIGNKTNEDLSFTLKEIEQNIRKDDFAYTCCLLTLIAKCPFSTIKGAIFNESFKLITFDIILRLQKNDQFQFDDYENVLSLLQCQQAICDNKMIPISTDTMDGILAFLIDINVKKFPIGDTNVKLFNSLHSAMTDLCSTLIKHRHILLMDRVPQFVHIFKDLLQAIVSYKSDRQKDTPLVDEEIDDLIGLALKMESLMHLIAEHRLEVKRVAPFVLTFAIHLMVSSKRPTTLYPKIKMHIENICYDLISICDHRSGHFILRCSNEAERQVYELLCKDHKKYFKFKGKV